MPQLYELNLRDYWNIFLKRKWIVITAFCAIFFSIFLYTSVQRSIYRASVLIKIDSSLNMPSQMIFPDQQIYWRPEEGLSGYVKQIVSGPILESALEELGYIKTDTPQKERSSIISSLSGSASAVEIEKTNMIRLDVNDGDPARASAIANKISKVFKRVISEQKNQQAHNVRVFIDTTLDDVSKKLTEQESRLRDLTANGAIGTGVNLVNQIDEMEKKRNDLLSKYTERHPNVVAIDEQISELKNQLKVLPKEEYEYATVKRDVTINESLYMSLKQKQSEAQIKEAEKADNVIIINPATPPRAPFYPDKAKSCTVGLVMGLIFGITLALVIEHIDTSIGRVEDIESFIKTSVLGVNMEFVLANSLDYELDEDFDMLFIDTIHNYSQVKGEIEKHHSKIKKYMILHDTITFGNKDAIGEGPGLIKAINEFLYANSDWRQLEFHTNNNGLTILERVSGK